MSPSHPWNRIPVTMTCPAELPESSGYSRGDRGCCRLLTAHGAGSHHSLSIINMDFEITHG